MIVKNRYKNIIDRTKKDHRLLFEKNLKEFDLNND